MKALLLVLALAMGLYAVRRRVKLALMVALGVYVPLSLWRLLRSDDHASRLIEAAASLAVLLALWGLLWLSVKAVERYRASHPGGGRA